LRITNQAGQLIMTVDEWFANSPPVKGSLHWQDGRSAKECAKAWLCTGQPKMPEELQRLLESNEDTKAFTAQVVIPEYVTKLDDYKGNGRNHDLIVMGEAVEKRTLIAIEAKVDETFGAITSEYVARSKAKNPRSMVPNRVNQLSQALFGTREEGSIRYQLIHAVAATLIEAKVQGAERAIFVVHQLMSTRMDVSKALNNKADFVQFVEKLTDLKILYTTEKLLGPITVPGGGRVPSDIPLYIGYVRTATI
jgi:hypothetical protein